MPKTKDIKLMEQRFKILVTGDYGTGKSVFASTFPGPSFLFDFDAGALSYSNSKSDIEYEQFNCSALGWIKFETTFPQVEKRARAGEFETVILDSTTSMTAAAMERALQIDPKRDETNGPVWNVHYKLVKNLTEAYLRRFIALPVNNIVLISHLTPEKDQKTGEIISLNPTMTGSLVRDIPGLFDEIYVARVRIREGKREFVMQTITQGLNRARSRIKLATHGELEDYFPNNYSAIIGSITNYEKKRSTSQNGNEQAKA